MQYLNLPIIKAAMATVIALAAGQLTYGADVISTNQATSEGLMGFPKNIARLHLGSTLLTYDAASGTYIGSDAASAWLDDDEATGWTPPVGKSYYLVALSEPSLMSSFTLSAPGTTGTVTLYVGDERSAPGATSWTPVARDLDIAAINEKLPAGSYNRYGRYLLVEANVTKASPWWSFYVYGREPAIAYRVEKRDQKVNTREILGAGIKEDTIFDSSNLYSSARVSYVSTGGDVAAWQGMIDESPESFWILPGAATTGPNFVVDLGEERPIKRISTLISPGVGVLEFYLEKDIATQDGIASINLDAKIPVCTLGFDGVSDREAIDFAPATGRYLLVRWKPTVEGESLKIRQVDAFSDLKFDKYAVITNPSAVAEIDSSKDKVVMGKNFKTLLDPIAEGPGEDPTLRGPLTPPLLTPPLLVFPTPTPTPPPNDPQSP